MKIIFTALEDRGSLTSDRLVFTSGLYCLVTNGDWSYDRYDGTAESAVECGRTNGLCTSDKELAFQKWDEFTKNHYSRRG